MRPALRSLIVAALGHLILASSAFACLWPPEEHSRISSPIDLSSHAPASYFGTLVNGQQKQKYWQSIYEDLIQIQKHTIDKSYENRIAVALIHLGRINEAIPILERLERTKPGSYDIAANLGTAYELSGNNERAIKWITEGMKRNPESHFGTEWLHLKILNAKQAIKLDPTWPNHRSVLDIDWNKVGGDISSVVVSDDQGIAHNAEAIQKAIEYQLHERTEFVKPPDPTVASLLHDLSHLVRISRSEDHGDMVFGGAQLYGYPLVDPQDLPPEPPDRSKIVIITIIASFVLVVVIGTWLTRRKEMQTK